MNKKKRDEYSKYITEDRMCQRVALELLLDRCPDMTIKSAKTLARDLSVQLRNTIHDIKRLKLSLTDEQANQTLFWIKQVRNAGMLFNQRKEDINISI